MKCETCGKEIFWAYSAAMIASPLEDRKVDAAKANVLVAALEDEKNTNGLPMLRLIQKGQGYPFHRGCKPPKELK